ncbi:MFS transporter [Lacrimispora amygdalina]|uniref:MFS transporter n=1 Tax=Lacrimispora amygdalina TaxID=253257 RepID=A0A3E2NEM8_9FIRM|nr:MFS transporter [Clostridium indicum]RFZ79413.1 MFS transporter [Clostridium indicum]
MNQTKKINIIISITAISFIQGLQFSISPVLGQIKEHYPQVSVSLIQMLVTTPSLFSVVVALASGLLVTKISKKKLLLFACFIAGITGFIPFLSDSFPLLFLSRTCYGIALGLACTLNTAVVAEFFEGDERVTVMGIQAASIGAGMVIITTLAGMLGVLGFKASYFIHVIAFVCFAAIALWLPDTGRTGTSEGEAVRLNGNVLKISLLGMVVFIFLITYTTNISMHLEGKIAGDPTVAGLLTGVFSSAQIVMGLILGNVVKKTGTYTLPAAMFLFCTGGVLLILFPGNVGMLMVGGALCGFSQGMFVPRAMCEVSDAVAPAAAAMAAACFTSFMCFGQTISPFVLNAVAKLVFQSVTTGHVYLIAVTGMVVAASAVIISKSM